jgi:hypothetical protein
MIKNCDHLKIEKIDEQIKQSWHIVGRCELIQTLVTQAKCEKCTENKNVIAKQSSRKLNDY